MRLDIFDESDHNQHIEKCIAGSGIYFGFRGAKEHTMLKVEDVSIGNYPKGSNFEGYLYFAVANLVDKTHALSAENGYRRDTTTLMKVPILSDDPASGDYGGTMKRMLEKALPNQKRLYHQMKKDGTLSLVVIGENKIRDLHISAARRMGVSSDSFRGGHAWRGFFVTNLVHAKGVSTAESMAAARHTSVSAHVAYQETDFISEGNRTLALLQSNDPSAAQEFIHKKNLKQNQAVQKSQPFASSIFDESSPEDTSLNCSELELNHDETASSAYEDYQELDTNRTLSKSDTYEFMHKSQDSTAADEEDYTSCHDKMPLYDCSARDRCNNTEPMNTQQEYDALAECMSTVAPAISISYPTNGRHAKSSNPYLKREAPLSNPYSKSKNTRSRKVVNPYAINGKYKVVANPYKRDEVAKGHIGRQEHGTTASSSASSHYSGHKNKSPEDNNPSCFQHRSFSTSTSQQHSVPNPYKCHQKQRNYYSSTRFNSNTMPNRHNASLSSEALVRKARDMVASSDLTQHQIVPMPKYQAAIRHMRKNDE